VLVGVLYVLRPGVRPQLVQGQVVVGQLSLQLPHFVVQLFQPRLQLIVELLVLVNLLRFGLQLVGLLLHALNSSLPTIIFSLSLVT
jgi:hypothetical protein